MQSSATIGKKLYAGFLLVILATVVLSGLLSIGLRQFVPQEYILIITGMMAILAGMVLAFVMSKSLTTEIRSLAGTARTVAGGDLTRDVPVNTSDEVGELATTFNQMVNSLREVVREVKTTAGAVRVSAVALSASAEEMNASTEEIAATVEQIAKGAEHQAGLIEQTSTVMREMARGITEIASRAKAAARPRHLASVTSDLRTGLPANSPGLR